MARTDQERYDQALAHIKTVNIALGNDVTTKVGGRAEAIGAELSLGGTAYWRRGSAEQHMAVRALLLCQIAYFRPPHANQDFASTMMLNTLRDDFLGKAVPQVNTEIGYFTKSANASVNDLAAAAVRICDVAGNVDNFRRTRTDTNVSNNPVCYHGVVSWLFGAGFISKRWLGKEGNQMTAFKANEYLGLGTKVEEPDWHKIPKGHLWNIHRANGDKSTSHWGVSLGDNKAAACNNTDESPTKKLVYDKGNTQYGTFNFRDICEVLNGHEKYGHQGTGAPTTINIFVRRIDPGTMTSYY